MRLNINKIFLACYSSFKEIRKDLASIKARGFDAIRLNPLEGKQPYYLSNLSDSNTRLSAKKNAAAIQQVMKITAEAFELGLVPMFDLELKHGTGHFTKHIDWFIDTLGFRGVQINCIVDIDNYILGGVVKYIVNKLSVEYKIDRPIVYGEFVGLIGECLPSFTAREDLAMKDYGNVAPFSSLMNSANEPYQSNEIDYEMLATNKGEFITMHNLLPSSHDGVEKNWCFNKKVPDMMAMINPEGILYFINGSTVLEQINDSKRMNTSFIT